MGTRQGKLDKKSLVNLHEQVRNSFSKDDIKTWYDTYRESRKAGHRELTENEFIQVYSDMFKGDASEFARHVFRTFDTDKSGTVDFKEFMLGLCVSGSDDTDTKMEWAFNMYDIDGDGFISFDELKKMMLAVCKMTNDTILGEIEEETMDKSLHNGELENVSNEGQDEQLARDERIKKITQAFFATVDTNNDGKISREEFRAESKERSLLLDLLECSPDTSVHETTNTVQ